MTLTMKDIEQLKKLEEKATVSPWIIAGSAVYQKDGPHVFRSAWETGTDSYDDSGRQLYIAYDAELVVKFRNLFPIFLSQIEKMQVALRDLINANEVRESFLRRGGLVPEITTQLWDDAKSVLIPEE